MLTWMNIMIIPVRSPRDAGKQFVAPVISPANCPEAAETLQNVSSSAQTLMKLGGVL